MDRIDIPVNDTTLQFQVRFDHDEDNGCPWKNEDGHGVVSEWTHRSKHPGEWVLATGRGGALFFDVQASLKKAEEERWGIAPELVKAFELRTGRAMTDKEKRAAAVEANFNYLRGWANGDWHYVHIEVTLVDPQGSLTDVSDSLGGVETYKGVHYQQAQEMAQGLADSMGETWQQVMVPTYQTIRTA